MTTKEEALNFIDKVLNRAITTGNRTTYLTNVCYACIYMDLSDSEILDVLAEIDNTKVNKFSGRTDQTRQLQNIIGYCRLNNDVDENYRKRPGVPEEEYDKRCAIHGLSTFLIMWEAKEISWSDFPPELLERFKVHLYKTGIINELSYRNPWR